MRPRTHNRKLPDRSGHLTECKFLICLLYNDIYLLTFIHIFTLFPSLPIAFCQLFFNKQILYYTELIRIYLWLATYLQFRCEVRFYFDGRSRLLILVNNFRSVRFWFSNLIVLAIELSIDIIRTQVVQRNMDNWKQCARTVVRLKKEHRTFVFRFPVSGYGGCLFCNVVL